MKMKKEEFYEQIEESNDLRLALIKASNEIMIKHKGMLHISILFAIAYYAANVLKGIAKVENVNPDEVIEDFVERIKQFMDNGLADKVMAFYETDIN